MRAHVSTSDSTKDDVPAFATAPCTDAGESPTSPTRLAEPGSVRAKTVVPHGHTASDIYARPEITALASSTAAVLTKSVLHPIDTLKCRVQLLQTHAHPLDPLHHRRTVVRNSLFRGTQTRLRQLRVQYLGQWTPWHLYGGLPVKLAFYVPYQALYLSSYNFAQLTLQQGIVEDVEAEGRRNPSYLWHTVAAAVFAEIATSFLRVPMETLKMRVQSTVATGSFDAVRQLWRNGSRACFRLVLPQTVLHDIPYSIIQWVTYETLRPWTQLWKAQLLDAPTSEEGGAEVDVSTPQTFFARYGVELKRTVLSGGLSGLLAAAATAPMDNVRTRVTVATGRHPELTAWQVIRRAYQEEGLRGFVRGGGMRVLWVTMNMACFYPLFEGTRYVLQSRAAHAVAVTR